MNTLRKIIDTAREAAPLRLRWKLGPIFAYVTYIVRIYLLGNPGAPKVLSVNHTLDLILKDNLSVIRFGDGEMSLIKKTDLVFQQTDDELAKRLMEIIRQNLEGLLICVPGIFGKLEGFSKLAFRFALHHQFRYRQDWLALLSPTQIYGDTFITRPYLGYEPERRKNSGEIFSKLFSTWRGKDVVLIEGAKSRVGVGNDMFKNAVSVARILCPPENAYSKYKEILHEALKVSKNKLILLALGPAAKVLGYDLFMAGYRVIDIGHADMEYEMYLRQESIQTKVKYKYFGEIKERDPEECADPEYLRQIMAKVE